MTRGIPIASAPACVALVVALLLAAALPKSAAASPAPNTGWTEVLPPAPSGTEHQPFGVPHCKKPRRRCIKVEIRRLKELRGRLACDHRGVFATTYLVLTRHLMKTLRAEPGFFRFPRYLFIEDALFANLYFKAIRADNRDRWVPEAWRIAFETARTGEVNAAQDMLLGINAHVQRDMPFVLAALGLRSRRGESRKPDHDAVNEILNRAYEPVVRAVERRYDPFVATTNSDAHPLDDLGGLEMVREWREQVWRNAEDLVNAESEAERRRVAERIEEYAAGWARGIAATQVPGERERRRAYCMARL